MVDDYPALKDVNTKQTKVWFQNRRRRGKHRKEMKKVKQLVYENEHAQDGLNYVDVPSRNTKVNSEPAPSSPQLSPRTDDSDTRLNLLAEETMAEFLLKAKGACIDWVPIPGIKPTSNSTGIVYVARNCAGIAARACAVIGLGPVKIMEILKERVSWSFGCRNVEVFAKFPSRNGGTIELIYTQFYAPTTVAPARDFWTLRYTSALQDGSFVVCEKSLSHSSVTMNAPAPPGFVRGKVLASGFLIRPLQCEVSAIHIIDHLDLEATSVPYMFHPLYESSELLAQRMTVAAIGHLELIAKEQSGNLPHGSMKHPASLRSYGLRLHRRFDEAINTFTEDGWSLLDHNASKDLVISTKPTRNLGIRSNYDGVVCVKGSMLLENTSPVMLVKLLRDHHSDWADIPRHLSERSTLLGHTINEDEILEISPIDHQNFCWKDYFRGSLYILQLCNGMDANAFGACSELIFAPIEDAFPEDATLLSSGFCILSLSSKSCNRTGKWSRNLAGYMNEHASPSNSDTESSMLNNSKSLLVTAFQFPFQNNDLHDVAVRALQYMHQVLSSVLMLATEETPASLPARGSNFAPDSDDEASCDLACVICQSYRDVIGHELLTCNMPSEDTWMELLWCHQDAVLCWSFQPFSSCEFANQSALEMLETTLPDMLNISLDNILDESGAGTLSSFFPVVMKKGYAHLPGGICLSKTHFVSYEEVVAWRVPSQVPSTPFIAFAFTNWCFI